MMSDVEKYIKKRKKIDPEFAKGFESGYARFKKCFRKESYYRNPLSFRTIGKKSDRFSTSVNN